MGAGSHDIRVAALSEDDEVVAVEMDGMSGERDRLLLLGLILDAGEVAGDDEVDVAPVVILWYDGVLVGQSARVVDVKDSRV